MARQPLFQLWSWLLLATMAILSGCSSSDSTPVSPPPAVSGHDRMLEVLREIAARTPREHTYVGDRESRRLREELAVIGPESSVFQRVVRHSELGQAELDIDNLDIAITHLRNAIELFPDIPYPDEKAKEQFRNRLVFILGTAYLRLGETQNCCRQHSSESCIVPIRGAGLHTNKDASKQAIQCFLDVLSHPTDVKMEQVKVHEPARWLLNIAYMTIGEYPDDVPSE